MKGLLGPAVSLMNRLSFGKKFGLISVLFFVPMLLTNFYLVRDSYRDFVAIRGELQSLALMSTALELRREMQDWKDLVEIEAIIGQAGNAEARASRLNRASRGLELRLQKLVPVSDNPEQVAEFNAMRDELASALAGAQAEQSLQSKVAM